MRHCLYCRGSLVYSAVSTGNCCHTHCGREGISESRYNLPMSWSESAQAVQVVTGCVTVVFAIPTGINFIYRNYGQKRKFEQQIIDTSELLDKLPKKSLGRVQLKQIRENAAFELAYILEFPKANRYFWPIAWGLFSIVAGAIGISLIQFVKWDNVLYANIVAATLPSMQILGMGFSINAEFNYRWMRKLTRNIFYHLNGATGIDAPAPRFLVLEHQPSVQQLFDIARRVQVKHPGTLTIDAINVSWPVLARRINKDVVHYNKLRLVKIALFIRYWITTFPTRVHITYEMFCMLICIFRARRVDSSKISSYKGNLDGLKMVRSIQVRMRVNHHMERIISSIDDDLEVPEPPPPRDNA